MYTKLRTIKYASAKIKEEMNRAYCTVAEAKRGLDVTQIDRSEWAEV